MAPSSLLLARAVRDFMSPAPPLVNSGASCGEAVRRMTEARATCIIVGDDAGRPVGIVTEQDVTRRMAFRLDDSAPVADAMTAPLLAVAADDRLYQALGTMRRLRLRHLPVRDGDGPVIGMLYLRDAMADATADIIGQIDRLTWDGTTDGLAAVKAAEIEITAAMLDDGLPAAEVQTLISHVNHDLYRHVVDDALAAMAAAGLGASPVPFAVLIMGSGGRGETMLFPDQDNGFVIADYPDEDHTRIDGFFIGLAERMCAALDGLGFPLCKGGVMAINPVWRKTLSQWQEQTRMWARQRSVTTVRLADIFFDFQPVCGDAALAHALRRHITALMKDNIAFLQEINRDQADFRTALGLFGRLRTERDGPFRGQVNLKAGGILPLVNAVRMLALRDGVAATSTYARIDALRAAGTLSTDEADEIAAALRLMSALVLRQQLDSHLTRGPVGNAVPPRRLTRREKRELVDALRAVEALKKRVDGELTGDVLTGGTAAQPA